MLKLKRLSDSGDTIVEVVIAMAIIGLILAGGYVTSNNSLHNETTSQETANALNLAESQVELMRGFAATSVNALNQAGVSSESSTSPFCMVINSSTSLPQIIQPVSAACTQNIDGGA